MTVRRASTKPRKRVTKRAASHKVHSRRIRLAVHRARVTRRKH